MSKFYSDNLEGNLGNLGIIEEKIPDLKRECNSVN
jgi:hypothetical protein